MKKITILTLTLLAFTSVASAAQPGNPDQALGMPRGTTYTGISDSGVLGYKDNDTGERGTMYLPHHDKSIKMSDEEKLWLSQIQDSEIAHWNDDKILQSNANVHYILAAGKGYLGALKYLDTPERKFHTNQDGVNWAYANAAFRGDLQMLQYLETPGKVLLPDQQGVNMAYADAALRADSDMLAYLDAPSRALRPGKEGIASARSKASMKNHKNILDYLNAMHPMEREGIQSH